MKTTLSIFISAAFVLITNSFSYSQVNEQQGAYISELMLVPMPQPSINGETGNNQVEIDFKTENPEMAAKATLILKKRDTGEEIKTAIVDFISEEGVVKYIHDGRKRNLLRNYAAVLVQTGSETFETLTAEAFITDKNGNNSAKAIF